MAGDNVIDDVIRDNLGQRTLERTEHRLRERYSISTHQGLWEFEKLDNVLREFFGQEAEGLEKRIFDAMRE